MGFKKIKKLIVGFKTLKKLLRSFFKVINLVLMISIIALLVFSFLNYWEFNPEANFLCATCHTMKPFYYSEGGGPHSGFSCQACHETTAVHVLRYLNVYLTRNPTPTEISRARLSLLSECLKCHKMKGVAKLRIHDLHLGVVERSGSCTTCHSTHAFTPSSPDCLGCHRESQVTSKHLKFHSEAEEALKKNVILCSDCHPFGVHPEYHGRTLVSSCLNCHTLPLPRVNVGGRNCVECHSG